MVKEFAHSTTANKEKSTKPKNGPLSHQQAQVHHLNYGEEDQMEIFGYTLNHLKWTLIQCFYFLTLGLLRLVFHWYPHWRLYATHTASKQLHLADKLLIVDNYKEKYKTYFVEPIETIRAAGGATTRELNKADRIISINGLIFKENDERAPLCFNLNDGSTKNEMEVRVVRCKKLTYVFDTDKERFIKIAGLDKGIENNVFHTWNSLTKKEQNQKRIMYGTNEISVPVQNIATLLVLEALTPFYMFQLFSLVVWLAEWYIYYGIAIVIMSVFGISTSIIQTRKNQKNLKGTVHSIDKVRLLRGNKSTIAEVPTTDLVPGDVIIIPGHGCEMYCDAVLLNGNCIVNESMLTGESIPVTKTALPNDDRLYSLSEHGNHTLFCGTKVIQTRFYGSEDVLAVVTRTGYLTSKGELVRSILYPPPADFKFDQDSYKFIMILAFIALLGFFYTIFSKFSRNISAWDAIIKALDIVTIAIPPALPAAMTVGKLYALNRLKKHSIFCINSRVINVSGSVDCVCFDKTGTLTEDGLDLWGVLPVDSSEPIHNISTDLSSDSLLFQGMLTCHSLTLIDGELSGDPLDIKMFEATGWQLEEPKMADTSKYDLLVPTIVHPPFPHSIEFGLIHQYHFSSTLQRMSIICRQLHSPHLQAFTKGSPEAIIALSNPSSIPPLLSTHLHHYTSQGYRVIAMATKQLPPHPFHHITKLSRDEIECNLTFLGLIVLENRLKPETGDIIAKLQRAALKLVMITGDNIETAVSVGRECGILQENAKIVILTSNPGTKLAPPTLTCRELGMAVNSTTCINIEQFDSSTNCQFVLNGPTWACLCQFYPDLVPRLLLQAVIFARMTGAQKQALIEALKSLGYYVAMCGDGANDCGALKAAHVGISLSEAESSVASPFTSKQANIGCVEHVIREGRAALVTSFGVFKLMLCYSLTEFGSVVILYSIDSNLTPLQFLFIDICLVLNFATFFGKTKAYSQLSKQVPMTSLLAFTPLMSMALFMLVAMATQGAAYYFVQTFDWFAPFVFDPNNTTEYRSYENYSVFAVSLFQYVTMAVIFSKGRPYREPIWRNYYLTGALVAMTGVCTYITLQPADWIVSALELRVPPFYNGRWVILVMAAISFVVCYMVEEFIVEFLLYEKVSGRFVREQREYVRLGGDFLKLEELEGKIGRRSKEGSGYTNGGFSDTDL